MFDFKELDKLEEVELFGTVFKDRNLRYTHTHILHQHPNADGFAEYCWLYDIGEEHKTFFRIQAKNQKAYKELPLYLISVYPNGIEGTNSCADYEEEWFFIDSTLGLNAFFREMSPLIEIAKYRQARFDYEGDK